MTDSMQITYRDVEQTEAIEAHVRKRGHKLMNCGHPLVSCRVAIEAPHRHKLHGHHYRVRIDLTLPGAELIVHRSPDESDQHENLYAAIDDAFDHALRRIHDHAHRLRSDLRSGGGSRGE
jgi:ribosomal subunit interface protein